ncbi:outer membrane protein assembly factor BamB family protein [Streptomyces sp. NPDC002004]
MRPQRSAGAGSEPELPEYAGQYRLEACLGSGGMGVVRLARSASGLRLAVKVVHAELARDPEFRGRFRQEVAAARRVSGAFTAPVVDADPEADLPWMATLYIPGPNLSEHVKRNGPLEPEQLRRLMAGLAEALRDIHRAGVVHRDLKPSNVLLAEDGPKVIDFGISRPSDSELRTETGKLIGTPPFMAPEQFRRPREVGPAADLFALGSVMVHASTGSGPFDSDSPYLVAYQVVHDEPDLTAVPENLVPLVARCLAKEPEDRPTPDELMAELRSVSASYDTQAFIPAQRTHGSVPVHGRPAAGRGAGTDSAGTASDEPTHRRDDPRAGTGGRTKGKAGASGTGPGPDAGAERPSAPRRKPLLLLAAAAGAVALATAGTLLALHAPSASDDGAAPRPAARGGVHAWALASRDVAGVQRSAPDAMPLCTYGSRRLFCARPGLITAVAPQSGKVLWRSTAAGPADGPSEPPVMAGGLVHVVTDGGRRLAALDPGSGEPRWSTDLTAYQGRVAYAGRMLLLTAQDGTVTGVDGATGGRRWKAAVPGQSRPTVAAFAGGGPAYATSTTRDGSATLVSAVDPETGSVRWRHTLPGTLSPIGTVGGGDAQRTVVLVSLNASGEAVALVRYDPSSGATRRIRLDVALPQAAGSVHGGTAYLMATGGALTAVDLVGGAQRWRLETSVSRASAPVADGGRVYVATADGRLLAVDARKGTLLGQTKARPGGAGSRVVPEVPAPLVANGRVYGSAPDGTVFAVAGRDPSQW